MVADRSALLGLMPAARRFPQPWTVEDHNDACFIVKDKTILLVRGNGQSSEGSQ